MVSLDREEVADRFRRVRAATEELASPLSPEDAMVQSMPDASPAKWHLAHTTWFFDEFVLAPAGAGHTWDDARWNVLYNSYYEAAGPRHPRSARGMLSRPSLEAVKSWRARVDDAIDTLVRVADDACLRAMELGIHHEEQHQELLLTDAKHALYANPLRPSYRSLLSLGARTVPAIAPPLRFAAFPESVVDVGASEGFAFDSERPRHRVLLPAFQLASRLVTNAEYIAFIEDGGYGRVELWLADGWAAVQANGWDSPHYWERHEEGWSAFGMGGLGSVNPGEPVTHVSFYEADAYARWTRSRLPTEFEWESVAEQQPVRGGFLEGSNLAPAPSTVGEGIDQMFGSAWQWTASAYTPYPGFRPLAGAFGEYNGKFMSGQMVLRGGSCFSPQAHLRATYRNYFPPAARWQVTGIRLARDA